MPFFNGIIMKDKGLAKRIIEFEDYTSPLFIDLTEKPEKALDFVHRRNTHVITNAGSERPMSKENHKRLHKQLPLPVKEKLFNNISKRMSTKDGRPGNMSTQAIGDIRSYFFKTIVELF